MRRVLVTVLLGAAGPFAAAPASACSCAGTTTAGFFERADAVFTGSLIAREVDRPPGPVRSSADPALHVFAVDTVFKGSVHEEQGVVSADAGGSSGLELTGAGPFVVFATRSPLPRRWAPGPARRGHPVRARPGGPAPVATGVRLHRTGR